MFKNYSQFFVFFEFLHCYDFYEIMFIKGVEAFQVNLKNKFVLIQSKCLCFNLKKDWFEVDFFSSQFRKKYFVLHKKYVKKFLDKIS